MSYTTKYDEQLKMLLHYQNYPQMLPFVGEEYDKQEKRLLIISESHYLDKDSSLNLSKWYEMSEKELSEMDKCYINTRDVVLTHYTKQKLPFKPITDAMKEYGFNPQGEPNLFKYVAWYNFFQRPAEKTGKSINPTQLDREKAEEVFAHIFEVLNPTHVVFASTKSWGWAGILRHKFKDKSVVFDYTPHPNTSWWNRAAYQGLTGKQKFQKFLKDNVLLVKN